MDGDLRKSDPQFTSGSEGDWIARRIASAMGKAPIRKDTANALAEMTRAKFGERILRSSELSELAKKLMAI